MNNPILPIAILLVLGTFAQAADPTDAQWQKMFEVMYDLPKSPKDSRLEQLKALIDQGADVNAAIGFDRMLRVGETRANLTGTTWPLDVAVQQARVDMVKLLLAKGAKFHGGELAQATLAGNQDESLAMITALLEKGADVNSRHDYGFTALFGASYKGNNYAVKLLLAQPGIKLDEITDEGDTALMAAAEHGHADIVEMLLKAGAKVSITDKVGETAITRAQKTLAKQQAIISRLQSSLK
jgi:ankyrin repeat protein